MQEHFHSGPQNEHVILVSIIARDFTQCVHTLWDSHNHSVYFSHFFFIFTLPFCSPFLSLSLFLSIFLPPFCPSHFLYYVILLFHPFSLCVCVCVCVCVCSQLEWKSTPTAAAATHQLHQVHGALSDGIYRLLFKMEAAGNVSGAVMCLVVHFSMIFCLFVYLFVFPLLFHCSVPEGQKVFPAKYPQEVESVTAKVRD